MVKKILLVGPKINNRASGLAKFIDNNLKIGIKHYDFKIFDDYLDYSRNKNLFLSLFKNFISFISYLKKSNVDIVQFHCNSDGISFLRKYIELFLAKIFDKPIIVRYGGSSLISFFSGKGILSFFFSTYFSMHDAIITQSPLAGDFLNKFVSKDKIFIVPNFSLSKPSLRKKRNIGYKKVVLFFGGGNIKGDDFRKGSYDLLNLLNTNKHLFNRYIFVCLNPSKNIIMKSKSMNLDNNILFLPRIGYEDTPKLYKKIDLLILPSYGEGFPNSIIECMSHGSVIISTHVGSIPDIITTEKNGYLVNPGDIREISKILEMLDDDIIEKISKNNFNESKEKYGSENGRNSLINVYNSINYT